MTVLKELLFSLVYYPAVSQISHNKLQDMTGYGTCLCFTLGNKFILERKQEIMKHFLKGTAVVVVVTIVMMIINIIINIICNKNGIDLNSTAMSMLSTFIGGYSAIWIYQKWDQK